MDSEVDCKPLYILRIQYLKQFNFLTSLFEVVEVVRLAPALRLLLSFAFDPYRNVGKGKHDLG